MFQYLDIITTLGIKMVIVLHLKLGENHTKHWCVHQIFLFLAVQGVVSVGLLVGLLLAPRGIDPDHVVDPEDRDGGLGGKLEGLDLGDCGLEDAGLLVVPHHSLVQVQAAVLQLLVLLEIKN